MRFPLTRIYADAEGESHFEDLDLPLEDRGIIGRLSAPQAAAGLIFRQNAPGYDWDFHHAPRRQYIVLLDGEIEIEVSDGEKRRFRGGEVLLVEDTWGKGHRTRQIGEHPRHSLFIPIE
jgi:quercetin dioxygenase-like cupin family protein